MAKKAKKTETAAPAAPATTIAAAPVPPVPAAPVAPTAPVPPVPAVPVAPAVAAPVAVAPASVPAVAKVSQNGITRPTAGTTTCSVWDVADNITSGKGSPATRAEVVAACTASGVNSSTATTQFGKWAKFNGLVGAASPGRASTPVAPAAPVAPVLPPASAGDTTAVAFKEGHEGYQQALTGVQVGNPYVEGSAEAVAFLNGWNTAHSEAQAATPAQ